MENKYLEEQLQKELNRSDAFCEALEMKDAEIEKLKLE